MSQPARRANTYFLIAIAILLIAFALRVIDLTRLPLYFDEMQYISRAQLVLQGHPYVGDIRKFAFYQFLSLYRPTGPESAWITRAVAAVMGTLTAASCIGLGRTLADRRAGLAAGLLYALLPFAVFHDRTTLVEPLQAALLALSLALMARLARRPRLWTALGIGLLLGWAYLSKISTLPYLALPPLAALLLGRDRKKALPLSGLSVLVALGLILVVDQQIVRALAPRYTLLTLLVNPVIHVADGGGGPSTLARDLRDYAEIMRMYAGYVVIGLVALSALWFVTVRRMRGALLFLAIPALGFAVPVILSGGADAEVMVPRYFVPTVAPLAALAALSLGLLRARLDAFRTGVGRWAALILLALALIPALRFDTALIRDPASAPLYKSQRVNFISGWGSGTGQPEIAAYLIGESDGGRVPIRVLGYNKSVLWMQAYIGPRLGTQEYLRTQSNRQRERIARWLGQGDKVYFLVGNVDDLLSSPPHSTQLEVIGVFDTAMYGPMALAEVVGATGQLADDVYNQRVAAPEQMRADYEQLAAVLSGSGDDHPILVFPSEHAALLGELAGQQVQPLRIESWPAGVETAEEALADLRLGEEGGPVDVILVDEAAATPDQIVALALQRHLYRTGEEWYGLLHRISYVTGPADPPLDALDAAYEQVIHLRRGLVLDEAVRVGGHVRVALAWETDAPIADSFRVFAHVMDETGTLRAQYDMIPGGGLFPMTYWEPGVEVVDRFAVTLPADLAPGRYEVRIGIYHPGNELRLPVTAGGEAGPDYAVAGRFAVEE
jgi:4-amino-4-deoxy-L-arabinose transferase-like glycosyltransferase